MKKKKKTLKTVYSNWHPHANMYDFRTPGIQCKSHMGYFYDHLWHFFCPFWSLTITDFEKKKTVNILANIWEKAFCDPLKKSFRVNSCFERRSADKLKTHSTPLSLSLACSHFFILDFLNLTSNQWEVWCVSLGGYVCIDDDCG